MVQSTVARMTGVTNTDIEFVGFCDFIVNQAKETDNLEFKAKKHKALVARVNQHQQGNGNGGKGNGGKEKKPHKPTAWKSDPDFSDFKSTSHTDEKWKSFAKEDRKSTVARSRNAVMNTRKRRKPSVLDNEKLGKPTATTNLTTPFHVKSSKKRTTQHKL